MKGCLISHFEGFVVSVVDIGHVQVWRLFENAKGEVFTGIARFLAGSSCSSVIWL